MVIIIVIVTDISESDDNLRSVLTTLLLKSLSSTPPTISYNRERGKRKGESEKEGEEGREREKQGEEG